MLLGTPLIHLGTRVVEGANDCMSAKPSKRFQLFLVTLLLMKQIYSGDLLCPENEMKLDITLVLVVWIKN